MYQLHSHAKRFCLCLMFAAPFITTAVQANIFVCKDVNNKTIYQDEPCTNKTIRTLPKAPEPSPEELLSAQQRIDKINERYQERAAAAEAQRIEQEKNDLAQEQLALEKQKIELLEKQALAEENRYPVYVQPRYPSRYGRQGLHRNHDRKFGNQYRLRPQRPAPASP
jgi:hypothetical protein